ncbi:MAG: M1 family aminopeptidase [bacterium]
MIVADADQGMENSMITMDGGTSPGYYSLLAHEIGHNWFLGTVGTNETYRAYLDEGFTSFIETWSMEKLVHTKGAPEKKYHYENSYNGIENDYRSYYYRILEGTDAPLTVPSDKYNLTNGSYGQVYYKGVIMLYALQYVLGDDLFQKAISYYFNKWKFSHPYSEDFRQAVIEHTDRDLVWFFDQWLDNAYAVDYAIKKFNTQPTGESWLTEIMLKRKEKRIMPLDLVFHLRDGSSVKVLIPVSAQVKKEPGLIVLPKWYGWDEFNDTCGEALLLPAKPLSVEIDPSHRMADSYLLDNSSSLPAIDISPVWKWNCSLDNYKIHWYPKLWYNDIDSLQLGVQFRGGYLTENEFGKHKIQFSPSVGLNFPKFPLANRIRSDLLKLY